MKSLIQLNTNYNNITSPEEKEVYLRRLLESCSRAKNEIDIIFKHYLNGGMLSEIISPSQKAMESNDDDLITKSMQALQVLDEIIREEKKINKSFGDDLITNFIVNKDTPT